MKVRHRRSQELPQARGPQRRVPEQPQVLVLVLDLERALELERALVPQRARARLAPVVALQRRHQ